MEKSGVMDVVLFQSLRVSSIPQVSDQSIQPRLARCGLVQHTQHHIPDVLDAPDNKVIRVLGVAQV